MPKTFPLAFLKPIKAYTPAAASINDKIFFALILLLRNIKLIMQTTTG